MGGEKASLRFAMSMRDDSGDTAPTENRRLAAIMFTDIVGFSRQMGVAEARMLRLLDVHNHII